MRDLDETCHELSLEPTPELEYFRGHFPASPILPGVVQIDWARHYGVGRFPNLGAFKGMETIKFYQVIQPGLRVTLRLDLNRDRAALKFQYHSELGRHSSGTLLFHAQA